MVAFLLAGCETVGFYQQAVSGQLGLLRDRVPVDQLLDSSETSPELKARLALSSEVLEFAETELGLAAGGRYQTYVDLQRESVVWNVFAAPQDSLDAQEWCYPIVGCAPYRGYFKQANAQAFAARLENQGLETYVGGVPAYSTLGWFDDPLLSSFVLWPEGDLVRLLIHELAHSRIWVDGDVAFNESFAEFVALVGAPRWFQIHGREEHWQKYLEARGDWRRFRAFLLASKTRLETYYQQSQVQAGQLGQAEQRGKSRSDSKSMMMAAIRDCYQHHRSVLGGGRFDGVMAQLNNAYFVTISTYSDWIPGFRALYASADGDIELFYTSVAALGQLPQQARDARLSELVEQSRRQEQVDNPGDHDSAQQIQCEPFFNHGLNLQPAG
ncbi:MAG: aminopeptidase [Pseudomonadota bacterium]